MLLVLLRASFPHRMSLLAALFLLALALLGVTGSAGAANARVGATSSYQTPPAQQSTPQPSKPILLTDPVPDPKQPGVLYFSPTGHTLRGSFLDYWNKNGGLAQFGYPLTEEFTEPLGPNNSPVMVQYFERNRFEHHPENAGTQYEMLLGTLGREFHQQDPPVQPLPSPALFFPQTGHNISGTFKAYWEGHGGLAVNGYPITEQFEERSPTDGKLYMVQYFERSRMELHPENAGSPYEVLLGQLGVQLAQKKGYPYGWYPQYGHAADFSWLAGKLKIYGDPAFFGQTNPPCAVILHDLPDARVQLNRDGESARLPPSQLAIGQALVFFGAPAPPEYQGTICSADKTAPIYIITNSQKNPANRSVQRNIVVWCLSVFYDSIEMKQTRGLFGREDNSCRINQQSFS